ncbi:MAG: Co2+/Mg2+ efflux protein ApaG [Deltaproteobacteria bacterium]|nr:MAG: Co2+/Mg2+ efflux protein ApaG [Deltaproteobacteria bacterium]
MIEKTTRGVRIRAEPRYHPERSDPIAKEWFFSYAIEIANESSAPVQLLSRHWIITDATGHVQHVRGAGVVGEQPRLGPGERFRYTSFCPLPTSLGSMHGSYTMRLDSGETFEAEIAPFTLVDPSTEN